MAKSKLAGVLDNRIYQLLFLAAVAGICLYTLVFFAIIRPKLALLMNKNNTTQQEETNSTQFQTAAPASPTPATSPSNNQTNSPITNKSNTQATGSSNSTDKYIPGVCTTTVIPAGTEYIDDPNRYIGDTYTPNNYKKDGSKQTCTGDNRGLKPTENIIEPFNIIVYRGTKPLPPPQPSISYGEAYSLSVNYCNSIGATSNTSAHQVCISAKLKTYGY